MDGNAPLEQAQHASLEGDTLLTDEPLEVRPRIVARALIIADETMFRAVCMQPVNKRITEDPVTRPGGWHPIRPFGFICRNDLTPVVVV